MTQFKDFLKWIAELALPVTLLAFLAAGAYYFHGSPAANLPTAIKGWDELVSCSLLTSLDGKRTLNLNDDGQGKLEDHNANKTVEQIVKWSLINPDLHNFRISFAGSSGVYKLVSSSDNKICLLISGSETAANLDTSWFSTSVDELPEPDQ